MAFLFPLCLLHFIILLASKYRLIFFEFDTLSQGAIFPFTCRYFLYPILKNQNFLQQYDPKIASSFGSM